jgi:hypothetical protein
VVNCSGTGTDDREVCHFVRGDQLRHHEVVPGLQEGEDADGGGDRRQRGTTFRKVCKVVQPPAARLLQLDRWTG